MNKLQASILLSMVTHRMTPVDKGEDAHGAITEMINGGLMERVNMKDNPLLDLLSILAPIEPVAVTSAGKDALLEYVAMLEARVDKLAAPEKDAITQFSSMNSVDARWVDAAIKEGYECTKSGNVSARSGDGTMYAYLYGKGCMMGQLTLEKENLERSIDEKQRFIDDLTKRLDGFTGSPDQQVARIAELEGKVVDLNSTIAQLNQQNIELSNTLQHHRSRNDELDGVVARTTAQLMEKDHRIIALTNQSNDFQQQMLKLQATPAAFGPDTPITDTDATWFNDAMIAGIQMAQNGEKLGGPPETVGATITGLTRDAWLLNNTPTVGAEAPHDHPSVAWIQNFYGQGVQQARAAFDNTQPKPLMKNTPTIGAYVFNMGVGHGWEEARAIKRDSIIARASTDSKNV